MDTNPGFPKCSPEGHVVWYIRHETSAAPLLNQTYRCAGNCWCSFHLAHLTTIVMVWTASISIPTPDRIPSLASIVQRGFNFWRENQGSNPYKARWFISGSICKPDTLKSKVMSRLYCKMDLG